MGIQMIYDFVGLNRGISVSGMIKNPWAALCIYVKKKRKVVNKSRK